jgi:hypothetical protein
MPVYGKSAIYIYERFQLEYSDFFTEFFGSRNTETERPGDLFSVFLLRHSHGNIRPYTERALYIYKNAFSGSTVTSLKIF